MGMFGGIKRFFTGEPICRKPVTTVELGSKWLKVAKKSVSMFGTKVTGIKCVDISDAGDGLPAVIDRTFKELRARRKKAITYIPRHMVTARLLRVPSANPDEVSRIVSLQAGRQTPYSKEEIVSGHQLISTDAEGYGHVFMVIARRSIINDRLNALRQAGVSVSHVGVSSEGLCRWFRAAGLARKGDAGDTVALMDIDASASEILVFADGNMVFSRSILVGAEQLSAEPEKWNQELAKETRESIDRYKNEHPKHPLTSLYLGGSTKAVSQVSGLLGEALKLPVKPCEPTHNIPVSGGSKQLSRDGAGNVSLSAAFGIAMAPETLEVDLTPPELHMERVMAEKRSQLNVLGVLGILIVTLACVFIFSSFYAKTMKLQSLDEQIAQAKPDAETVDVLKERVQRLRSRLDPCGTPMNVLAEIHRVTPASIQLTSVHIVAGMEVSLRGRGGAMSDVFSYVKELEESALFTNAKTTYTSQKQSEDRQFAQFEINCRYEEEPSVPVRAGAR